MAGPVHSPENELRFTRSGQGVFFWLLSAVLLVAAITLWATASYRHINPFLPHPAWGFPPLVLALLSGRLAWHLTRHAYLILTPLGIEIFPFFRPARGMQLVTWQEVALVELDDARALLTLHFNPEKTAGIRLSLKPIRPQARGLLAKALTGRAARVTADI